MRRLADERDYMSPKVSKQRQLSLLFLSGIMEAAVILEASCILRQTPDLQGTIGFGAPPTAREHLDINFRSQ